MDLPLLHGEMFVGGIPSYQHIALVLYDPRTQIFGFDGKIVVFA